MPLNLKHTAKAGLRKLGWRLERMGPPPAPQPEARICAHALEALHRIWDGAPCLFQLRLDDLVDYNGFAHSRDKFHPHSHATRLMITQGQGAADAFLERYYATFQPANAA